jgi:prefoldin subunit 5
LILIDSLLFFLQNLLNALEVSRVQAGEEARSALAEAQLRADVSVYKRQRDEAHQAAAESSRKVTLLSDELHQTKTQLARVTQEKMKLDRDQRVALSIAKSLDSQNADVDYYKRKVTELSGNLQSMYTTLAEKDRQLENLRNQLERQMNQNSLAQWSNGEFESSRKRMFP